MSGKTKQKTIAVTAYKMRTKGAELSSIRDFVSDKFQIFNISKSQIFILILAGYYETVTSLKHGSISIRAYELKDMYGLKKKQIRNMLRHEYSLPDLNKFETGCLMCAGAVEFEILYRKNRRV